MGAELVSEAPDEAADSMAEAAEEAAVEADSPVAGVTVEAAEVWAGLPVTSLPLALLVIMLEASLLLLPMSVALLALLPAAPVALPTTDETAETADEAACLLLKSGEALTAAEALRARRAVFLMNMVSWVVGGMEG